MSIWKVELGNHSNTVDIKHVAAKDAKDAYDRAIRSWKADKGSDLLLSSGLLLSSDMFVRLVSFVCEAER
jgi:hypothetical protein